MVLNMKKRVLAGELLGRDDAVRLSAAPLEELAAAADEIRFRFCQNRFDLCAIVNGKCGKCTEDCIYCAQSAHYKTACTEKYPLLPAEELVRQAGRSGHLGVRRFSIVTSGKRLSDNELDQVCESIREIRLRTGVEVCVSFGLLGERQFRRLKDAGVSRVHCNLESSARFFPKICTTHSFIDKVETLKAARRAGLDVCSGGILGLGETMEDRIDMCLTVRELGVRSIPLNLLNPIPGTPCEHNRVLSGDELCAVAAVFRFLVPDAFIRLAGGRSLIRDRGGKCFRSGANAAISGDMLTTAGVTVRTDLEMIKSLGYEARI